MCSKELGFCLRRMGFTEDSNLRKQRALIMEYGKREFEEESSLQGDR